MLANLRVSKVYLMTASIVRSSEAASLAPLGEKEKGVQPTLPLCNF